MKSEIIAVGSEMLTPFRQDTNSLYMTEKLNELGVTVAFKTIVGDRQRDLVSAIRAALGRTDIVVAWAASAPPKTTSPARPSPKLFRSRCAATPSRSSLWPPAPLPGQPDHRRLPAAYPLRLDGE